MTNKEKYLNDLRSQQNRIYDEIQKIEHELKKEKHIQELTEKSNSVADVVFKHDKETDNYYLAFYLSADELSRPLSFKLTKEQFHDLQTLIHTTLEENEMTNEERNAMNLMNHFFHINNFKPIGLKRG